MLSPPCESPRLRPIDGGLLQRGLKSPRIVQEADDHATILSLVACRLGVALVSDSAPWQCPRTVALLPIVDLNLKVSFSLIWRKDNKSPLLQRFVAQVEALGRKKSVAS